MKSILKKLSTIFIISGGFCSEIILPKSQTECFCPVGSMVILHQVDVNNLKVNSDDLYISINDFLDKEKLQENERDFYNFIAMYTPLIINHSQFHNYLVQHIIPSYEKFIHVDFPCEVSGQYSESVIKKFQKFLNKRLLLLKLISQAIKD